jgi:hypothetical protein
MAGQVSVLRNAVGMPLKVWRRCGACILYSVVTEKLRPDWLGDSAGQVGDD